MKEISFDYAGSKLRIFKGDSEFPADAIKKFKENFEEIGKEVIKFDEGSIRIDWSLFSHYYNHVRSGTYSESRASKINSLLIDLGIFSLISKGNWEIMSNGPIGLNPRSYSNLELYFTRQEDVIEYARINYARTLYHWEIRHYDQVIGKNEALKGK
jgi:hypothetical protein